MRPTAGVGGATAITRRETLDLQSFEQLLESLPIGVALISPGPDFVYVYANAVVQALNPGVPMVGRTFVDVWPSDFSEIVTGLNHVWETGRSLTGLRHSVEVTDEDGTSVTHELECGISLVDVDGESYLLTTCNDITERLAAMRESEEAIRRELEANVVLQETSRLALTSLKPDVLAQRLVADMQRRFALRSCNAWLVDPENGLLTQVAQVGFLERPPALRLTDESDGVRAVVTGTTVVREDTSAPEVPEVSRRVLAMLSKDPMALLALPLATDDGVFGCLVMVWPQPRTFSESEIALFEAMAAGLALGLRNARLDQAVAVESALMAGANRILEAALFASSEEELGDVCLRVAEDLTDSEYGFIGEMDGPDTMHHIAIDAPVLGMSHPVTVDDTKSTSGGKRAKNHFHLPGKGEQPLPDDDTAPRHVGLYEHVLRTGESVCTNDPLDHGLALSLPMPEGHPEITSFLGVALKRGGTVVGVISVSNRLGGYREQDQHLLESLAPAISAALYSARARRELAFSNQLLSAHVENSPLGVVEFDPEFRVIRWSDEAERIFGYTRDEIMGRAIVEIPWVFEDDKELVFAESDALLSGAHPRSKNVNRNHRKDGTVIWCEWYSSATYDDEGKLISVLSLVLDITGRMELMDALIESERRANDLIRFAPTGIYEIDFTVPCFTSVNDAMVDMTGYTRDELLAMNPFDLLAEDSRDRFRRRLETASAGDTPDEAVEYKVRRKTGEGLYVLLNVRYTRDSSGSVTGAFVIGHDITERRRNETERARLFAKERESARLNEALTRIDRHIHGTFNRDEVYKRVVDEAGEAMGAEGAAMMVFDEDMLRLRYLYGLPEALREREVAASDAPIANAARDSGQPVFIEDTSADERAGQITRAGLHAGALVLTPVAVRGDVAAVVLLAYSTPRIFSEAERTFARRLAASLGLALANIELYEAERDIAETLQETLVVLPARVHGAVFSHAYQSATSEKGRVGGDFIDVFEVSDDVVGISLGDVSGKGIEAAVITSLVRTTLRVHALDGSAPGEVAAKTNAVVRRSTTVESYVTLWFGMLDTSTGLMRYVCAGHPPALVVDASGEIRPLKCLDPILGAFEDAQYAETQFLLTEGDRLILYTDGVTEARSSDGEFLDATGLLAIIERHAHDKTEVLAEAIMDDVIDFSSGSLRDDVAILVVQADNIQELHS